MSEGLNKVLLLGNIGQEPESSRTNDGTALLKFSLATSESYLDRNKQRQEKTEWHRCIVWRGRAEGLAKVLKKGDRILVEGKIETSTYEKNGEKRYSTQIVVQDVKFAGGGNRGGSSKPSGMTGGGGFDSADYGSTPDDDDIPFISSAFLTRGLNGVDRI